MKRNASIELFRILMMYGICLLHCLHWHPNGSTFMGSLLLPCVNAFVFITGWYGIRFTPSKVLRLYGVQFYCVVVMMLLNDGSVTLKGLAAGMTKFWFGHAYVLMMLLAPLVNRANDDLKTGGVRMCLETLTPLFIAVFAWGFAARFPFVRLFVPAVHGLDAYSGVTLLATYAGARLLRQLKADERFGWGVIACGLAILVPLVGFLHLGMYYSPFAFAFAAGLFLLFDKVKLSFDSMVGKIILLVSPSMFSVFFFHLGCSRVGVGKMVSFALLLQSKGLPIVFAIVGSVFLVFMGCVVLDVPRRILIAFLHRMVTAVNGWLDGIYCKSLDLLAINLENSKINSGGEK